MGNSCVDIEDEEKKENQVRNDEEKLEFDEKNYEKIDTEVETLAVKIGCVDIEKKEMMRIK